MTSLRTKWGIDIKYVEREFGSDYLNSLLENIEEYEDKKDVNISDQGIITLTPTGKLLADQIASELFILD
jgi:oxygen-independent coproporphyrinogen-3 oxidase